MRTNILVIEFVEELLQKEIKDILYSILLLVLQGFGVIRPFIRLHASLFCLVRREEKDNYLLQKHNL